METIAFELIQKLCSKGCNAYITGGAVRDLFSGDDPNDWDIVTEATSEQLDLIFKDHKINHIGKSFEVTIVDGIEIAGYRKDIYFGLSDKNSKIEPAETLIEDLSRRDLTINSMAFCPYTNELIDPYNGKKDLENKIIKFTGNPEQRIYEDPCRIIRACRFIAKIEGNFEDQTYISLLQNRLLSKQVAPERIRKEILKTLIYKKPSIFFKNMMNIDILGFVLPSLHCCFGLDGGQYHNEDVFTHSMLTGDYLSNKKPLLRLAGYLHDVGKFPKKESKENKITFIEHEKTSEDLIIKDLTSLKFSTKEIHYISKLAKHHMRSIGNSSPKAIRRLLKVFLEDNINWKDWLQLKIADRKANLKKENYTKKEIKKFVLLIHKELNKTESSAFSVKNLAVNGNDIMNILNIKPGKKVGKILNYLLELVLDNPELNNKSDLINVIIYNYMGNKE